MVRKRTRNVLSQSTSKKKGFRVQTIWILTVSIKYFKRWKHKGLLCIQCGGKKVEVKHLFCRTENITVTIDSRKWLALLQVSYLHAMAKLKWSEKIWSSRRWAELQVVLRKSPANRSILLLWNPGQITLQV